MATQWLYERDGRANGPVSVDELRRMAASGELKPEARVCKAGTKQWVRAKNLRDLFPPAAPEPKGDDPFDFFGGAVAAEPKAERGPDSGTFDFFGGLGGTVPVAQPVSDVPVAAAVDDDENDGGRSSREAKPTRRASVPEAIATPLATIADARVLTGTPPGGDGTAILECHRRWLVLRTERGDGTGGEVWLRRSRVDTADLSRHNGLCVVTVSGGGVRLAVAGDESAARGFLGVLTGGRMR